MLKKREWVLRVMSPPMVGFESPPGYQFLSKLANQLQQENPEKTIDLIIEKRINSDLRQISLF
jgi:hypothetical protein